MFPKSRTGMIAADTGEKVVLFVFPFTSFKLASIRCKTLSFSGDYMWRNCVQPSAGTQKRLLALGDSRQTSLEWFRFPTKMGQQGFFGAFLIRFWHQIKILIKESCLELSNLVLET